MKKLSLLVACIFLLGSHVYHTANTRTPDGINWLDLEEAQKLAAAGKKKILVYNEASWCTYCRKMEKEIFPEEDVQDVISQYYYPVRVDIESDNIISFNENEMTEQEFALFMQISGTPTLLFLDGEGNVLGRQPGFLPADIFKALLTFVGSDAQEEMDFNHFYENEYQE